VLFLLTLLLPVAGRLSRLPGRVILLSAVLFVLALLEVTSAALGKRTPFLAALHPANALLMVGLTVVLLIQGWQLMRERRGEMKPR
jgi:cytochrome bd-type quinol oxidase subunit 1